MPRAPCAIKETNGSTTSTVNAPISGSNGGNDSSDSNGNGDRAAAAVAGGDGGAMGGTEETEAERRALYDLKARQRTQFIMDVSRSFQLVVQPRLRACSTCFVHVPIDSKFMIFGRKARCARSRHEVP